MHKIKASICDFLLSQSSKYVTFSVTFVNLFHLVVIGMQWKCQESVLFLVFNHSSLGFQLVKSEISYYTFSLCNVCAI